MELDWDMELLGDSSMGGLWMDDNAMSDSSGGSRTLDPGIQSAMHRMPTPLPESMKKVWRMDSMDLENEMKEMMAEENKIKKKKRLRLGKMLARALKRR